MAPSITDLPRSLINTCSCSHYVIACALQNFDDFAGCPNDCTGKGLCKNSTCTCLEGWSGSDCSIGSCGNCSRGSCVEGFCQCDLGWEGAACDKQSTCFAVNNCTSEVHGSCKTTDVCECNTGYTGISKSRL